MPNAMQYLTIIHLASVFALNHSNPVLEVEIAKQSFVIGEPIVLEFVVINKHPRAVCSVPHSAFAYSFGPRVEIRASDRLITTWTVNRGCGVHYVDQIDVIMGECLSRLESGQELRARATAVLLGLAGSARDDPKSGSWAPLPPGRYELVGQLPWGDATLESAPISIEFVSAVRVDDRKASQLVDRVFASFLGDLAMVQGVVGPAPAGSVARILEDFPNSVHAEVARSRLLILQGRRVLAEGQSTAGSPQSTKDRTAAALEMARRIERHLATSSSEPLEPELLRARIDLLEIGATDPLELARSCDDLLARFPTLGLAHPVRAMRNRAWGDHVYRQASRLIEAVDGSGEKAQIRAQRMAEMLDVTKKLDELLETELDDLDGRRLRLTLIQLLDRFERVPEVIEACIDFIKRYPDSSKVREVAAIREKCHEAASGSISQP